MSDFELRELDYRGAPQMKCEWQECENLADFMRNSPWGDLAVCRTHTHTPFFGEEDS